jgi:hypothetical protein
MRTFVINQQEHPLNGGNQTSSSSLGTTTTSKIVSATTDLQGDTKPSNLPVGTCWVCLQAATKAAKERQVEEDRKLAASLSSIILEEEQDRADEISIPHYNNNIDNDNDNDEGNAIYSSNGDHYRRIGSIGTSKSTSHYRDEGLVAQEWLEEGKALIPMVSTKATQTSQTEEGQQYQNHDLRNNAEYRRHPPKNQECNTNGSKNHVADNGFPFIYIGEYNSVGQRHGPHGEIIWDSGDRYVGTFKNGMRSGQGTFFFQDGKNIDGWFSSTMKVSLHCQFSRISALVALYCILFFVGSEYTGDWSENQMHGRGQQKFANGDTYVGQYHKSERSGGPKWKYKFANGDLYVGGWEANRFHGFGRYFYADGSVLEGNFLNGAKHGKFKRQLPTKDLDILRFEDDHLVGKGVRWNAKRTKTWLLEFRNSNPHATTRNLFSDALKSRKKHHGHGAHRMVLGISNFGRRFDTRQRHSQTSVGFPSSVGASDGISTGNDEGQDADNPSHPSLESFPTSALSSTLPLDNLVTVVPQEKFKSIVKKSTRIPISQAVSIGYDCENGAEATGIKPSACQVPSK